MHVCMYVCMYVGHPSSTNYYYIISLTVVISLTIIVSVTISSITIITPSPPTKSLGFEGFDSSRLLILRGENSHVR